MASLQERIEQFRKMSTDDPTNDLAHFSLGKALMEAEQPDPAAASFRETLRLNPEFSKAYQFLGQCLTKSDKKAEAIEALKKGFTVADGRGDRMPRDEMGKLLVELGETPPATKQAPAAAGGPGDGFVCARPGCPAGASARKLPRPPINDEMGHKIFENTCAACWQEWLGMGVKVINEMRLDLSSEQGQQVYDNYMKEFLGLE